MNKEQRLKEIDKRIVELKIHMDTWIKAGGDSRMVFQAKTEIDDLELEKEDLINGTNKLKISKLEREIYGLKNMQKKAHFFKKSKYNTQIKELEEELQEYVR